MEKWEYKFETGVFETDKEAQEYLNELRNGWVPLSYDAEKGGSNFIVFRFLLMRRIGGQ